MFTKYFKKAGSFSVFEKLMALVLILILSSLLTPGFGQSKIYLQHQVKPHRQISISLNKEYTFKTADSTFTKYHIVTFSEKELLISSIESKDTVQLLFADIERIVKIRKFGLFEAIGTLGLVCLISTPGLWATGRSDEASDMLLISGFLLTVSVPVVAVRRIGRNKDIKNKWTIRVE